MTAVIGRRPGDVTQRLEIAIPLSISETGDEDLRKLGELHQIRVRRRQIVRLVREHQIESIEPIAREHGQIFVPIIVRVIPVAFQVGVMEEVADAAHWRLRRCFRRRDLSGATDLLGRREQAIH